MSLKASQATTRNARPREAGGFMSVPKSARARIRSAGRAEFRTRYARPRARGTLRISSKPFPDEVRARAREVDRVSGAPKKRGARARVRVGRAEGSPTWRRLGRLLGAHWIGYI